MKKLSILFLLLLMISTVAALELVEVYSVSGVEKLFSIFLDKSTYKQGETVFISEQQPISAFCGELSVKITLTDSKNNVIAEKSNIVMLNTYPTTAKFTMSQTTKNLAVDKYKLTSRWFCSYGATFELGSDGKIDDNVLPNVNYFTVVPKCSLSDPRACVTDPKQSCSKQCSVGYKLVNSDSPDCFCEKTWVEGDGKCDLGEPVASNDCGDYPPPPPPPPPPISPILIIAIIAAVIAIVLLLKK